MVKIHTGKLTAHELMGIKEDNRYRIGSTPLGQKEGESQMYIGKAVPWKGVSFKNKTLDQIASECGIAKGTKEYEKLGNVVSTVNKLGEASRNLEDTVGAGFAYVPGKGRIYITNHNRALMKAAGVKVSRLEDVKMPRKPTPIDEFVGRVTPIAVTG